MSLKIVFFDSSCRNIYICWVIQRILSIVILVALLSQSLVKSFIVVHYQINKSSITKKYCENKAKPKMHCDGKCHLKKQLKKEEKREKMPLSGSSKENSEVQFFVESDFKIQAPISRWTKQERAYFFSSISIKVT